LNLAKRAINKNIICPTMEYLSLMEVSFSNCFLWTK